MSKLAKPLRFTHLYLENWRNFTRVETDLARRVVVAGPNASGKSNLLDALRFLHDIAGEGGGFQRAVRRRGGVSRLRCLAARQHSNVVIAVRIGSDGDGPDWEYGLQFGQEDQRPPAILHERVARGGEDVLVRPDEQDLDDPERLSQTALEQVHSNRQFRELAEFFASVRYVNAVPQLVREPERSAGRRDDPFCGDLLERIAGTPEKMQTARLRRILQALQGAVPQLLGLELRRDARGLPHLRARYSHWRPLGAWQTEDQFSDGTLRLLALLWSALEGAGPLLAEEPEQSLHPEVIRQVLPMLSGIERRTRRQIVLTTHSKDLLDDAEIDAGGLLLLVPGEEETKVASGSLPDACALLDGCYPEAAQETSWLDENQLELFPSETPVTP
ncbi:MAG: AAA family ATPase [Bryobacteraceae bacterium]|jgi:energy-coupling factor transporter ATP-binding protein EcfA2